MFNSRRFGAHVVMIAGIGLLTGCAGMTGHSTSKPAIGNAPLPAFANAEASTNGSQASNNANPYASAGEPDANVYKTKADVVVAYHHASQCRALDMHRGEVVSVRLPVHQVSALAWQLDHRPDGLSLLSVPKAVTKEKGDVAEVAGQDTTEVYDWRFKAENPTHGQLRLLYDDPNDPGVKSKAVFECNIRVR